MKVFGHPVHLILIHFPSALLPMDFVCSLLASFTAKHSFVDTAFYAAAGGVLLGWLAVITGLFDLIPVAKDKPRSLNKALLHGSINSTVLIGFTVLVFISYKHYPVLTNDSTLKLIVKGLLVLLLLAGNYLGGSLILKDRVAVEKN